MRYVIAELVRNLRLSFKFEDKDLNLWTRGLGTGTKL